MLRIGRVKGLESFSAAGMESFYTSRFSNKQTYMGTSDVSHLPDGMYSMEVYAGSKVGYGEQVNRNTFEIQSQFKRSVSINPKVDTGSNKGIPLQAHQ